MKIVIYPLLLIVFSSKVFAGDFLDDYFNLHSFGWYGQKYDESKKKADAQIAKIRANVEASYSEIELISNRRMFEFYEEHIKLQQVELEQYQVIDSYLDEKKDEIVSAIITVKKKQNSIQRLSQTNSVSRLMYDIFLDIDRTAITKEYWNKVSIKWKKVFESYLRYWEKNQKSIFFELEVEELLNIKDGIIGYRNEVIRKKAHLEISIEDSIEQRNAYLEVVHKYGELLDIPIKSIEVLL